MDQVFSALIYGPSTKCVGDKTLVKEEGSVTYSMDQEDGVTKILVYLYCLSDRF